MKNWICIALLLCFAACKSTPPDTDIIEEAVESIAEVLPKGVKMIPIQTPKGTFNVYTKKVGDSPTLKVLLLHGGPGGTHEFWEPFADYLPQEGIEYYYYDQLGSYFSDQPSDTSLWTIPRFVDEVEQVRTALELNSDNFILLGQSWGGILAMEYALVHQDKLKGLVISNMMSSIPDYNNYVMEQLAPKLPKAVRDSLLAIEAEEDYTNPRYMALLEEHYYPRHVLNMPLAEWPEAVGRSFEHLNPEVYVYMQGPSEFGVKGGATLSEWDITDRLPEITVPALVIAGEEDTMSPDYLKMMSEKMGDADYLVNPGGGHLVQFDSKETYYPGLIRWLKGL